MVSPVVVDVAGITPVSFKGTSLFNNSLDERVDHWYIGQHEGDE